MRSRIIHKKLLIDSKLQGLSLQTLAVLFALPCLADGRGVFEDEPEEIRASLFPYHTDLDMEGELKLLVAANLIFPFINNAGNKLIGIVDWKEYQRPHPSELNYPSWWDDVNYDKWTKIDYDNWNRNAKIKNN